MSRAVCLLCRRPSVVCWCADLVRVPSRTRVVFLQHPRESRQAVGTCRMAHLSLPNSELHVGVRFAGHARISELSRSAGAAVLFPEEGAPPPDSFGSRLSTLIVLDGSWAEAKKLLLRNPELARLPRVGLRPARPGNYRIRKEPAAHCLATIEAVVEALGQLEGDASRFEPMLDAFTRMVDRQLAYAQSDARSSRHLQSRLLRKERRQRRVCPPLSPRDGPLVALHAEANAFPRRPGACEEAQLLQWVAVRVGTDERFEALTAPRGELAPGASRHLEVPVEQILAGEPMPSAQARWAAFLRPDDQLCTWGTYALDLLRLAGAEVRSGINLRHEVSLLLGRKAGGVEGALALWNQAAPLPWAPGRAGRRIAAIEAVARRLMAGAEASG